MQDENFLFQLEARASQVNYCEGCELKGCDPEHDKFPSGCKEFPRH